MLPFISTHPFGKQANESVSQWTARIANENRVHVVLAQSGLPVMLLTAPNVARLPQPLSFCFTHVLTLHLAYVPPKESSESKTVVVIGDNIGYAGRGEATEWSLRSLRLVEIVIV